MPSRTASETWSQIVSGWPSVTDSEVRRKEREELKDVVTTTANDIEIGAGDRQTSPRIVATNRGFGPGRTRIVATNRGFGPGRARIVATIRLGGVVRKR